MYDILQQTLKTHHHSVTTPRKEILTALQRHQPCATAELARACPDIDRVTVYRTIQLFEETGIVKRVWLGFKSVIELSELFSPHHHHLVCQRCGTTIEIQEDEVEAMLHDLAEKHHFSLRQHSLELTGECPECRVKHPS